MNLIRTLFRSPFFQAGVLAVLGLAVAGSAPPAAAPESQPAVPEAGSVTPTIVTTLGAEEIDPNRFSFTLLFTSNVLGETDPCG